VNSRRRGAAWPWPLLAIALTAVCARPPAAVEANTAPIPTAPDSVAARLLTDVRDIDSTIRVEARYHTSHNFTGAPLPGYQANRALLRREAAAALGKAQRRLAQRGLGLLVYDGYRPVRATLAMVDWAERTGRVSLLDDGYIARRSRHNMGVAVDLTVVSLATGAPLDMGTPFDTFDASAHTANATGEVARNRSVLVEAMEAEGFVNYLQEWWHFSFEVADPVPFDVPVR
jgi:D-alanyl-D-alanine dipeptidase